MSDNPSLSPFSSFKHCSTKALSLKKSEVVLPNSPQRNAEIVTILTSKFKLRFAASKNKGGRPM